MPAITQRQHSEGVKYKFAKIFDVYELLTPAMNQYGGAVLVPPQSLRRPDPFVLAHLEYALGHSHLASEGLAREPTLILHRFALFFKRRSWPQALALALVALSVFFLLHWLIVSAGGTDKMVGFSVASGPLRIF